MSINGRSGETGIGRNELDMGVGELRKLIASPTTPPQMRLKAAAELHSRFALPFASLVFALLAVPLGIQSRRSGKSVGFTLSIAILLFYYILMSLLRTLAEKGDISPVLALWLPNLVFLALGWILLRLASRERSIPLPSFDPLFRLFRRRA